MDLLAYTLAAPALTVGSLPLAALADLLNTAAVIGITALALGFVIFVHELGHFAVAKMCGVRCEKFFVGFDVGGYKVSKQIGETEYGVGILPLGGYVKMFGQDDNVANLAEQLEQSKQLEGSPDAKEIIGPSGDKLWVDRRSYLAKSVPQRMAIISAGVVMNVIFAFIFAWIAFGVGVPETPAKIGFASPGGPAWEAGLRTGDRIAVLNGIESPTFNQLIQQVILTDLDQGLAMTIERPNTEPFDVKVQPRMADLAPRIKVQPTMLPVLRKKDPVVAAAPSSQAEGDGFQPEDRITAVNGEPVESYADLAGLLIKYQSEPITYTLQRKGSKEEATTTVSPNPMERLGIVATLGPIAAVQNGSPAADAGLAVGDRLLQLNGAPIGAGANAIDPLTLDDYLAEASVDGSEEVTLTVLRAGESSPAEVTLQPRSVRWSVRSGDNEPLGIESLGVACPLLANVAGVVADSPAAEAGLAPGDSLTEVTLRSSDAEADGLTSQKIVIELGEGKQSWPVIMQLIQDKTPGLEVDLQIDRGGEAVSVTLAPAPSATQFWPPRGIGIQTLQENRQVDSWSERASLAWEETTSQLSGIFRLLQKLGGQVSVKALGGPVMIAQVTGQSAFQGWGPLLMTLTMFSANLAVLNFLPIPVLDGGHMVFLAYEGLTGRPANERIVMALHVAGMIFLLSLMAMVFTLDISRLLGIAL
ncbi:MAG: site-2 protease family protein [Planctomycetota bacterium]